MGLNSSLLTPLRIGDVGPDVVVEIPTFVLVNGDVHGGEFMVDIFGAAVGEGHAAAGDDESAEETGGDVAKFVAVGMVEPEDGAGIVGAGTGAVRNLPDVGVGELRARCSRPLHPCRRCRRCSRRLQNPFDRVRRGDACRRDVWRCS